MAYVLAPDGTPGEVPDDQLDLAVAQGFRPRTPTPQEIARKRAGEQPVVAAIEGAARGLTAGFGEGLVRDIEAGITGKSREQVAEEMRLRKEENPAASVVGEIGGVVGSFATGPAGLLSKGLQGVRGAGLAGRAAAGAVEGGLFGLGSIVSESVLEDTELTGERLAAAGASGALTGAVIDSALYGVGKGVSTLTKKLGGKSLQETLENLATSAEKRQLLESSGQAEKRLKARGGNMDDVVRIGREEGVINARAGMNQETVKRAEDALDRVAVQMDDLMKRTDAAKPLTNDAYRKQVVGDIEQRLRDSYEGSYAAADDVEKFITTYLKPIAEDTNASWGKVMKLQSDIRKKVGSFENTMTKEVHSAGRKLLRNTAFAEAADLGADIPGRLHSLQKKYAALAFLKDVIDARAQRLEATGGPFSIGLGGMLAAGAGASVGGVAGGIAGAAAMKVYRERGGFLVGSALRELADSNTTSAVGKALHAHMKRVLDTAPELLGPMRATIAASVARGADDLLETHLRLASAAGGGDYLASIGLSPETPEQVQVTGERLAQINAARRAAAEYDASLMSAADGILGAKSGRPASWAPSATSVKDYNKTMEGIQRGLANPERAFEAVPPEMFGAVPATASAMTATLLRGLQFLDSKAPKSPYAGMPASVAPQWEPSQVDLDRFARYKEAVENPAKVLKNIANGYMSPEQVEAMRAVYPRLYADLQQKLGERLAEIKKPLTYQQKMGLQLVLGPTALGMTQQQTMILQQTHAGAGAQDSAMRKPDGRQSVDAQKNMQTQSQRLESRGMK